jgi:hypothetical protein
VSVALSRSIPRRWLKRVLLSFAALLLVLLSIVLGTLALLHISPAQFEVLVEEVGSKVIGRELQIGQLLEIELGLDTYVLAEDVSLANPDWADIPEFARVGRLLIRINLPSIWLDGPVIIRQLELDEVSVGLLAPDGLPPSWNFWPGDEREDVIADKGDVRLPTEKIPPVVFSEAHIRSGKVIYRDSDQNLELKIEMLELQDPQQGDLIKLDLNGAINAIPLQVRGQFGPAEALITQRNLSIDLDITWGQLQLQGRGSIDDLLNLTGSDLNLKVSAPQSRPLLDALGMPEVRDGPLQFEARITDAHPGIALRVTGSLGEFDVDMEGNVSHPLALDGVDMTFKLQGPSLAEAGAIVDFDGLPDITYQVAGEIFRDGAVLGLKDVNLNAGEAWMTVDGNLSNFPDFDDWKVKLAGGRFNVALLGSLVDAEDLPSTLYDFNGSLESTDDGSKMVSLQIDSPLSRLVIGGSVGKAPAYLDSSIKIKLVGSDLASAGAWLRLHDLPNQAFEVSGELTLGDAGWKLNNGIYSAAGLQLEVSGEVNRFPDPQSVDAKIAIHSPDLASALQAYNLEVEGLPAFSVTANGRLSGSPHRLVIDEAQAKLGNSKLTVSGVIGEPDKLTGLDLAVMIVSPDLLQVLPVVSQTSRPALPVDVSGQVSRLPGGLAIDGLKGRFGSAQISMEGAYNFELPHEGSHVVINTDGPDLNAVLGPWLEWDIPSEPFTLSLNAEFAEGSIAVEQLDASVGDNHLSAQIEVDRWDDPNSGRGRLKLYGDSSTNLAQTLGYDFVFPDSEYAFNVVAERSPDRLRLNPVSLNLGKSDYAGRVDIQVGAIPVINADLHSKHISLPHLLPDLSELEKEAAAAGESVGTETPDLTASLTPDDLAEKAIPDEALDFSWLHKVQASIKYQVDEIKARTDATSSAAIDFSISNGVLSSQQLRWDGEFVNGDAQLRIAALEEGADVDFYLDLTRIPLVRMLGGEPIHIDDELFRAQIDTSGNSLQTLIKNSDGVILFQGGGGRFNNKGLGLVVGDVFQEIFNRLNPFTETDPYTEMTCYAGAMSIKGGVAGISPGLVVRSSKMDIAAGGSIELASEALDLAVNTRARTGIGFNATKVVTPYFRIGGTLANPRLVVDKQGVAVSGSVAIATGGLSILAESLWDRWVATANNPCDNLFDKAVEQDSELYQTILDRPPLRQKND